MLNRIKKTLQEHSGFISLVIRTVILVLVCSAMLLWLTEYFRHFFPRTAILEINPLRDTIGDFLTTFAQYSVIAGFLFFVIFRDKLLNIIGPKTGKRYTILYLVLSLFSFGIFFMIKYLNVSTASIVVNNLTFFVLMKYLFMFLGIASTAFAVYGHKFIGGFTKQYWKSILMSFAISIIIYNLVMYIRHFWYIFSKIVTYAVYFLLNLTFDNVRYNFANPDFPLLAVGDFAVLIGSPCSGIDGMTLFITLYVLIVSFDWKNVNKKKVALFLPIGTLGMFAVNTFRVYLLIFVGKVYSREFAIGAFHSNIGWILFLCYFVFFLYVVYPHLLLSKVIKKAALKK